MRGMTAQPTSMYARAWWPQYDGTGLADPDLRDAVGTCVEAFSLKAPEPRAVPTETAGTVAAEIMAAGAPAPAAPDCESSQSGNPREGCGRMGCESQSDQPVAGLARNRECSLLVVTEEGETRPPRSRSATYSQSTSDRALVNGSEPADSRSSEIASDSPTCCPVDTSLRRYPKVVSHRRAKSRRDAGGIESRKAPSSAGNVREAFIAPIIPSGTNESRPDGSIPKGNGSYNPAMTREWDQVRTDNFLRLLREQYGDSPSEFCRRTGYSESMVSQIKKGRKKIGEKLGAKLEQLMSLKRGALEQEDAPTALLPARGSHAPSPWPFSVPYHVYEALSAKSRRDIDESLTKLVMGAQSQELLERQQKTRRNS